MTKTKVNGWNQGFFYARKSTVFDITICDIKVYSDNQQFHFL
jgi:hypothetical protein